MKINTDYIDIPEVLSVSETPVENSSYLYISSSDKSLKVKDELDVIMSYGNGITVLTDFSNVNITTPTNGEVLKYSSGEWINAPSPSIPINLSDLNFSYTTDFSNKNGNSIYMGDSNWHSFPINPAVTLYRLNDPGDDLPSITDSISSRITQQETGDSTGGDYELINGGYFCPISSSVFAEGLDYGIYQFHAWFYFKPISVNGTDSRVIVNFVEMSSTTTIENTINVLDELIPSEGSAYNIHIPFLGTDWSGTGDDKYAFEFYKDDDLDSIKYWFIVTLEKIGHDAEGNMY